MSANPYAPPRAAVDTSAASEYWRDGKTAVLRPGGTLPPRCVKCNEPAVQPMKSRRVYWHHWAWYLLIFANIVIYAVVALIIRRKADVTYGVCARHTMRRRVFIGIGIGGVVLGALAMAASPPLGMTIALVAVLAGIFGSRLVHTARITKEEVRLAGCNEAFLESLERPAAVTAAAKPSLPKAAPKLGRVPLGTCPSCKARLPIDVTQCVKCGAAFPAGLQARA